MSSDGKMIGGILVLSIVIIGLIIGLGGQSQSNTVNQEPIKVETGELVRPDAQTLGLAEAPVTVVEFADFQCPACALATPILNQLIIDHPDQVRLVYRHLPLTSIHANAFSSAQAAEAAGAQGQFWEMHDLLYANQKEWEKVTDAQTTFADYAVSLGLDRDQFQKDFTKSEFIDRIRLGLGDSQTLGLQSTPTIFVNGVKADSFDKQTLEDAVSVALTAAQPTPAPAQ